MDDLVRWGKVLYIGCCNFSAFRLIKALGISKINGLDSFVSIQPMYNVLKREVEKELLPFCLKEGIGVVPYNSLAGGFLTGKYRPDTVPPSGTRLGEHEFLRDRYLSHENFQKTSRFLELARQRRLAQLSLRLGHYQKSKLYEWQSLNHIYRETQSLEIEENLRFCDWMDQFGHRWN